jgi:hypothetical protein
MSPAALPALARALLGALALAGSSLHAAPALHGPYKDVTLGIGAPEPVIARAPWQRAGDVIVWAFATGECGQERWGDFDTDRFVAANVRPALKEGPRYIVSTGGALGVFTCGSAEGLARFVARYDSPRLAGLDFDIEGAQTPAQIDSLIRQLAPLHRARPELRLSFTVATHAGSDAARRSLNATGQQVLKSLRAARLDGAVLNLMVMNYGPADPRWCVVRAGRCDMGRSAVQAVRNVHERFGVPHARIAVTAMPGENDVEGNVFTVDDARHLASAARRLKLAGVHHWSLDRDQGCAAGEPRLTPRCHSLPDVPAGRFGQILGGR